MKRVLTAAVAIPIVVFVTLFTPDWFFAFFVGFVCALAADEFLSLADKKGLGRPGRWFLVPSALVAMSFQGGGRSVVMAFALTTIALMTVMIFSESIDNVLGRVGMGLAGVAYCSLTLGFLIIMRRDLVLLLFSIIWIGDSAAYYVGRARGRHALAPRISPKKTIEGAAAGLIGSVIAGVIGAFFLGEPLLRVTGISAATAIAGQVGDLAESVLKRSAGVKDSSSILPGHGGILDRLDSLFFAAPIFYWLFNA